VVDAKDNELAGVRRFTQELQLSRNEFDDFKMVDEKKIRTMILISIEPHHAAHGIDPPRRENPLGTIGSIN
jgi:hypothetical protein